MRRRILLILTVLAVLAAMVGVQASATAAAKDSPGATDIRAMGPDYNDGKRLPFASGTRQEAARAPGVASASAGAQRQQAAAQATYQVGDERTWLALDDTEGIIYLKDYTLRGVGDNIEVWVASDSDEVSSNTDFQPGDCRNGSRTQITDEQVQYLIGQFDDNIYPTESRVFSVPPERDGSNAVLPGQVGLPPDYYQGEGNKIVTLIDNVRDDNFYDLNNTNNFTYIAGFFYSVFNEFFDRNVMSIDAFDWLHRTGANPPNEPVPGDNCANAPARPFLYEGVFAHEYQHLLEYYEDVDEVNWVNEGLSDFAQTITGYVDPSVPITDIGFDSHVQCFLGYLGIQTPANPIPREGGPENSLTSWGDQGDDEILCDYGAAYTMMEMLAGRYGVGFMTALHRDDDNGLASLDKLLKERSSRLSALQVVHDWAAMVALDGVLDDGARLVRGGPPRRFQTPTLDATINWDTPEAYSTPGAPPNGSDYVRVRDAGGDYLKASQLRSLSFDGASSLPPLPVEWTVDSNPPGHPGDPALYSGSGDNLDRAIVRPVTVPTTDPTLTFDTYFSTEEGWDFGFVQVSTDGGKTYTSLGNDDTTTEADPGTIPAVHENLPGFTGNSGGGAEPAWISTSFDLSAYAGQEVLLAFRYITDSGVTLPGWWIDDLTVGGTLLSDGTTLSGWQSATQVSPIQVSGFTVQLVAYTDNHKRAWRATLRLDENFNRSLSRRALGELVGTAAQTVSVIVTYDDPTESINQYAPYILKVNGVTQPGGGSGAFVGRT